MPTADVPIGFYLKKSGPQFAIGFRESTRWHLLKILNLFAALIFTTPVLAQEVQWLTKEQARDLVQKASKDPSLQVNADQQGQLEIKSRTPETKDTEIEPAENDKASNWQFMYNLGVFFGSSYLNGPAKAQGIANSGGDFNGSAPHFGFEIALRPPHKSLKRLAFGYQGAAGNGIMGPKEDAYSKTGEFQGERNGLVPYDYGAITYKEFFVEYDALMLPWHDPRFAFSVGYRAAKVRSDWDQNNINDKDLYSEQGLRFKIRAFLGRGSALTPYMLVKLSNKNNHSILFGFNVERGPRVFVPKKKTK